MSLGLLRKLLQMSLMLLAASAVIFVLIDAAPGSPLSQMPLTLPPEVQADLMRALGADQPAVLRYLLWLKQFFWVEPLVMFDHLLGTGFADGMPRILSWQSRSPVMTAIVERLPQTLWVVGGGYLLGAILAISLALVSVAFHGKLLGKIASGIAMIGTMLPSYVLGLLLILLFALHLRWLPSVYDTTLTITNWHDFGGQLRQMLLPVLVLAFYNAAEMSRYLRSAMLDQLGLDYVRAARARGLPPFRVLSRHVLRNAALPLLSVVAMGIPSIFAGAIITEQLFRINGLGSLLLGAVQSGDLPMAQSLLFIYAMLILAFNLAVDLCYRWLDPRLRDA